MSETTKELSRAQALQASYSETTAWLIKEHKDEFDAHRAEVLKGLGFEWAPKLTQEQKDAAALAELLSRNPRLLEDFRIGGGPVTDGHS